MIYHTTVSRNPQSVKDFLEMAEQGFFKANPDAKDASIEWEFAERVTFPSGLEGFSGVAKAKCPGYRDKTIVASWTKHGLHVH